MPQTETASPGCMIAGDTRAHRVLRKQRSRRPMRLRCRPGLKTRKRCNAGNYYSRPTADQLLCNLNELSNQAPDKDPVRAIALPNEEMEKEQEKGAGQGEGLHGLPGRCRKRFIPPLGGESLLKRKRRGTR